MPVHLTAADVVRDIILPAMWSVLLAARARGVGTGRSPASTVITWDSWRGSR